MQKNRPLTVVVLVIISSICLAELPDNPITVKTLTF